MQTPAQTLDDFLSQIKDLNPTNLDLIRIIKAISISAIDIKEIIETAPISNMTGSTGKTNIHKEEIQLLDNSANTIFVENLMETQLISHIVSEELQDPLHKPTNSPSYFVSIDPVDGSSNITSSITIGSILGIWKLDNSEQINDNLFIPNSPQMIAAIYTIYGPSTILVIACNSMVNAFALNPAKKAFIQTHKNIKTPSECKYYSVNENYFLKWTNKTQKTISFLRDNYSLRYVGSLIADFHRNLLNGGIFLYPENKDYPNGKLRLLYEILPLSYIIENAGGIASTGKANPLTIKPSHHHQKTPLIIGSKKIVTKILSML
ncbi:MAG: fructose-1,6-bisphosphatase class 1 [Chloroflexota bacterium]|nr:fructose-1,6-bisphosphatase [SAR202 cluster bacterium]GIT15606.1 MAG: fructose-1,6-bisphosphatase class 1 [Chloroflexota bacterium]